MNKRIKTKWIKALLSKEYKQGTNQLRTADDKFCCLGVLGDLYVKECKENWTERRQEEGGGYILCGSSALLPLNVMKWAGLDNIDPAVLDGRGKIKCLSTLNDTGWNFKRIAQKIKEQF